MPVTFAPEAVPARFPRKLRELHNHHFDLDHLERSGVPGRRCRGRHLCQVRATSWVQQIVAQLVFNGDPEVSIADISPWVDLRAGPVLARLAVLAAQKHRRILKTHLPVDALRFSPKARYIHVARDGRDVALSLHHHHLHANDTWYADAERYAGSGRSAGPARNPDAAGYFREWLDGDGAPFWPFWENVRSWWAVRDLPNVHLVHFEALKRDMASEIRRIADFLEVDVDARAWLRILRHCGFDWMKANAPRLRRWAARSGMAAPTPSSTRHQRPLAQRADGRRRGPL